VFEFINRLGSSDLDEAWPAFWELVGAIFIIMLLWQLIQYFSKKKRLNKQRIARIQYKEKFQKKVKKLQNEATKELNKLLDEKMEIFSTAYRNSVSTDSFGKKNYSKFIKEMEQYFFDNIEALRQLEEDEVSITIPFDAIIDQIEEETNVSSKNLDYDETMSPYDYEFYCAQLFEKEGWVAKVTQASSDQGVDVQANKGGLHLVAQCKKYAKPVGNKAVQEIVAGMRYYNANKGVVIATNGFTRSAVKLANANNINLIHHSEIKTL